MECENKYDWQPDKVFTDEKIDLITLSEKRALPTPLLKAREMEKPGSWLDRQAIFLKQGKFLADYEDDFEFFGDPVRYYPTYQSLTDAELRGYFAWRTKARKKIYEDTSLSFIFLYIYEIINNIGVKTYQDGFDILCEIYNRYGPEEARLVYYLDRWKIDYIVYYNLDASLLSDTKQAVYNQCINILDQIESEKNDRIIDALKTIAPKWISRSKFYSKYFEDMDIIICRIFKKISQHYSKGYKRTFVEQLFGIQFTNYSPLFSSAIFCNPLNIYNYSYNIDSQFSYKCQNGIWTVNKRQISYRGIKKIENLIKTIDSVMRKYYKFGYPIKTETKTKWIIKLIEDELSAYLEEKKSSIKKKLNINFTNLDKIRDDSIKTRDKLIIEEDEQFESTPIVPESSVTSPLLPSETRLIYSLLYNESLAWIKEGGHILSVLIDGINEKLYEKFSDTVIDDSPQIINDYIDELKEMIPQ